MSNTHETTVYLPDDEDEHAIIVEIEYDAEAEEPSTWDYPGYPGSFSICSVTVVEDEAEGGYPVGFEFDADELELDLDALEEEVGAHLLDCAY